MQCNKNYQYLKTMSRLLMYLLVTSVMADPFRYKG